MLDTYEPARALRIVKLVHTAVWVAMAASILAIPILAWQESWTASSALIVLVLIECGVLALNGMRCPLTDLAGRFTDDRRDNFDIYLPLWLARYNKHVFGVLFVAGLVFWVVRRLT